jgi:uncharacterized membrane protein
MGSMLLRDGLDISLWIMCIEAVGSLVIVVYVLAALARLVRNRDRIGTRLLVAEGALWGLNFKVAASLLKTIALHSWAQIGLFTCILALRTLLKWIFSWEEQRLRARLPERAV